MKAQHFIITSLQIWETEIGTAVRNITLELSRQNKVLYINTPMDHSTWLRKSRIPASDHRLDVINKKTPPLRKVDENLWILDFPFMVYSINKIPFPAVFDFFNKINNRKIAKFIRKYIDELKFNNYTLFIDNDIYRSLYMKDLLKPSLSIYYRRDFVIGQEYWKKHGTRLEPQIIAKADLALGNSKLFCEEIRKYNPNVQLLETGVNLDLYDYRKEYQTPADMKEVQHPIVGYVGSIDSTRLDDELLCNLAEKRPAYNFVLTGPEDDTFRKSRLHQMKNVLFTGFHKVEELPSYILAFDVCINPQKVNEITDGNYPLKIDEYLAFGKPVVATTTHFMKDVFASQVHLADKPEDYPAQIDKALNECNDSGLKDQRIAFALTHSWEDRIKKLYEYIGTYKTMQD